MTEIPSSTREIIRLIIKLEGGFTPPHAQSKDPMTLFGVIDKVWAAETHQSLESARLQMQQIGRLCEPYSTKGHAQPKTGMPLQAHARMHEGLTQEQKHKFQTAYNKAADIFFHAYLEKPGFDQYPSFIQTHLLDFNVNKGPSLARWALTEAMRQEGILPKDFYKAHHIPQLTAEDAVDPKIFRPHKNKEGKEVPGPASWYGSAEADKALLPYLKNISPEKQKELIGAYSEKRRLYYYERGEANHGVMAHHVDGWNTRVDVIDSLSIAKIAASALYPSSTEIPKNAAQPSNSKQKSSPHR